MRGQFGIEHTSIQVENLACSGACCLQVEDFGRVRGSFGAV